MRQTLLGVSFAFAGAISSITAQAQEWEPFVAPFNQIFPSVEIASANMSSDDEERDPSVIGDDMSMIGVTFTASRPRQRVRVKISLPSLMADSVIEAELPRAGVDYEIYPPLRWNYQALTRVRQSRPETVSFEVSTDNGPVQTKIVRARVRSVNDALYSVDPDPEVDDDTLDFNWMFAAYVNEDSPLLDEILRDALDTGLVESFDGYQSEDQEQVYAQVFALWYALQQRGIRYSNITATASTHESIGSQNVRFIEQSWRNTQANCVDGSVLFASLLRKIDIAPLLVSVPGHMFLGFALDEEGEEYAYLETTMLGDSEAEDVTDDMEAMAEDISDDREVQDSYLVFAAALAYGQEQVDEAGDRFEDESELDYQMIDIQAAREQGVMPITIE